MRQKRSEWFTISIDTALEKGREEGMAEGMEKGMAKGMEKEKLSTARRLLSMGLSEEQVSTATELPLEEIQKLREQAWTGLNFQKNNIKRMKEYEDTLQAYRDVKNSIDTVVWPSRIMTRVFIL